MTREHFLVFLHFLSNIHMKYIRFLNKTDGNTSDEWNYLKKGAFMKKTGTSTFPNYS